MMARIALVTSVLVAQVAKLAMNAKTCLWREREEAVVAALCQRLGVMHPELSPAGVLDDARVEWAALCKQQ
jgi:hypothetical protein